MKKPKALNLYLDLYKRFEKFSDAQAGRLIKAMLRYGNTGEETDFSDDLALDVTFCGIIDQIDRDFEKYRDICQKRSEIGRRGAQALRQKNQASVAIAANCCQEEKEEEYKKEDKEEKEEEYKKEYNEEEENKNKAHSAHLDHLIPLEYISDVHEVIHYLNQVAGTHIRVTNFGNGMLLTKLFQKGNTVEDCKRVIDNECDRLMEQGTHTDLLSVFLFGTHFEEYAERVTADLPGCIAPRPYLHTKAPTAL